MQPAGQVRRTGLVLFIGIAFLLVVVRLGRSFRLCAEDHPGLQRRLAVGGLLRIFLLVIQPLFRAGGNGR